MGNAAAKAFGLEEYLISTEESIAGIADLVSHFANMFDWLSAHSYS